MTLATPPVRPAVPHFSSGPCAKRPGWNPQNLTDAVLGRSHRSKLGKGRLKRAIDLTREIDKLSRTSPVGALLRRSFRPSGPARRTNSSVPRTIWTPC